MKFNNLEIPPGFGKSAHCIFLLGAVSRLSKLAFMKAAEDLPNRRKMTTMQSLVMYAAAESTLGIVRDYANSKSMNPPVLTKGFAAVIRLRLFAEIDNVDAYPADNLASIASWQCVWDKDYSSKTAPPIIADNDQIHLHTVVENINGTERTFTEIVIPVSNLNTQGLTDLLADAESVSGLSMELVGFDASGTAAFGLQIKGFTVRNRIYYGGTPEPLTEEYLTAAQVRALIAGGVVFQFSPDNLSWHDIQTETDRYLRFRSASTASALWSEGIAFLSPSGSSGGGVSITVDSALSETSINPVQNRIITAELRKKITAPANGTTGQLLSTDGYGNFFWVKPTSVTVDTTLSTASTNPIANSAVTAKINELAAAVNNLNASVTNAEASLVNLVTIAEGI